MTENEIQALPMLLTVQEAAKICRVSKSTMYEAVTQGQIPTITLNKKNIRIPKKELLSWIDNQTNQSRVVSS